MKRRPRLLLADDHAMVLEAFRRLLEPRCEIVGVARNGRTLLELAATTEPEIIILDVAMPKLNGLEACARLRRKMPEVKCIFLTVNEDPDFAAAAIRIGASGYVLKSSTPSELFTAIECALAGKLYITPLIRKGVSLKAFLGRPGNPPARRLSARQCEVLQFLSEGRAMKEIAGQLHITARTVAFHKYTIMEQLRLKNNAELVRYAVEHGLLRKRPRSASHLPG
jgi:DNA-binding NarL/FixJ family response regulator